MMNEATAIDQQVVAPQIETTTVGQVAPVVEHAESNKEVAGVEPTSFAVRLGNKRLVKVDREFSLSSSDVVVWPLHPTDPFSLKVAELDMIAAELAGKAATKSKDKQTAVRKVNVAFCNFLAVNEFFTGKDEKPRNPRLDKSVYQLKNVGCEEHLRFTCLERVAMCASVKDLPPQARTLVGIMYDQFGSNTFSGESLAAALGSAKENGVLKTKQPAMRIFQYYKAALVGGGFLSEIS